MRNKVIDLLDQTIEELDKEKIDGILEIPPKDDMGDFAFPCFQLAKVFRKAPNMIATEIAEKIPASGNMRTNCLISEIISDWIPPSNA